jgi:hypothetical protein
MRERERERERERVASAMFLGEGGVWKQCFVDPFFSSGVGSLVPSLDLPLGTLSKE